MKGRDRWERCANKQKRRRRRRDREKRSVDELTVRRWRLSVRSQQKKETRETAGNVQNENVALKRVKYNSSQKTALFHLFVCFFILSLFYSIYFKKSYLIPKTTNIIMLLLLPPHFWQGRPQTWLLLFSLRSISQVRQGCWMIWSGSQSVLIHPKGVGWG